MIASRIVAAIRGHGHGIDSSPQQDWTLALTLSCLIRTSGEVAAQFSQRGSQFPRPGKLPPPTPDSPWTN